MLKTNRSSGFTLVELLVTLTIIGILTAIAVPSYQNYVIRGSRTAAQTELLQLASLQEKIYLNSNCYTSSITMAYNGTAAINNCTAVPVVSTGGLNHTDGLTSDGKYTLSITTSGTQQTFTITATPVPGKTQENDGTISISENGLKTWANGAASGTW